MQFINIVKPCHLSERKKELPSPKQPIVSLNCTVLVLRSGKRFAKQLRLRNNGATTVSNIINTILITLKDNVIAKDALGNIFKSTGALYNEQSKILESIGETKIITNEGSIINSEDVILDNNKKIPVLNLGNIDARRDWSDAEDFMEGVWIMLNQEKPKDYVLGRGEMHSVRDFLDKSLEFAGIDFTVEGEGENEKYYTIANQSDLKEHWKNKFPQISLQLNFYFF